MRFLVISNERSWQVPWPFGSNRAFSPVMNHPIPHGNPHVAAMKGAVCPRGAAGPALIREKERPQAPMMRVGERGEGQWRTVSWNEALDYVVGELTKIKYKFGPESIALSDRGGPFRDMHRAFLRGLGTPNYCNHDASCARNVHHANLSLTGLGRKDVVYDLKNARHVVLQLRNIFESVNVQVILCNKKVMINILFRSVSETLLQFCENPENGFGGKLGFMTFLHTWDQKILDHFHIHILFRLKTLLWSKNWVVDVEPTIENPDHVIEYVGRYTHRVAIANHRILDLSHGKVAFSYKDRKKAIRETMTIDAVEFIRRFLLHVLPRAYENPPLRLSCQPVQKR